METEVYDYIEDRETPKNHTRKLAKVTLYLDVPSNYSEGTLEQAIELHLGKIGMFATSPSEAMVSDPGSDNPEDFEYPVGFIAPDGKFYLVDGRTDGLAHLNLADFVRDVYQHKGMLDDLNQYWDCGLTVDYVLERAGFVKVHKYDVRYLAHFQVGGHTKDGEPIFTPDLTEAQVRSIVRYGRIHGFEGDVYVNDTRTAVSKIAQADKLCLREIFSL